MKRILSKNDPKVTPKGLPKSSKNRSWGRLRPQDEPKMVQEGLREPIWTISNRFWIDFDSMFDKLWTECQ